MNVTSTQPDQVQGAAIKGIVHGGQNPVSGASVYLYAVGAGGYGGNGIAATSSNASTSLLNSNVLSQVPAGGKDGSNNYYVTTDSGGNFSISADYTCPSASTQVYLYAIGGNSGAGANGAIGMLDGLGSCGSLSSTTYILINEVSTIATAYALAGFATDATHISSSGSTPATTGIANAFASVANLETLSTGVALATTPAGNGMVPQAEIDTLANILAACVNSTGPSSTGCTTLLGDALSGGTTGTAPTDTATAAINIAHNPIANLTSLFALQTANSPFMSDLSAAPNDFTILLGFTAGGLFGPRGIAIDGAGNVWVSNLTSQAITELSNAGTILSGATGYIVGGGSADVAVDGSGNVWATSYPGVVEIIGAATPVITPICAGLPTTLTTGTSNLGTRP